MQAILHQFKLLFRIYIKANFDWKNKIIKKLIYCYRRLQKLEAWAYSARSQNLNLWKNSSRQQWIITINDEKRSLHFFSYRNDSINFIFLYLFCSTVNRNLIHAYLNSFSWIFFFQSLVSKIIYLIYQRLGDQINHRTTNHLNLWWHWSLLSIYIHRSFHISLQQRLFILISISLSLFYY